MGRLRPVRGGLSTGKHGGSDSYEKPTSSNLREERAANARNARLGSVISHSSL